MGKVSCVGWEVSEEEEYKRVPQLKRQDVDDIMDWSAKQPHLPKFPRHRALMFLRACDFSMERTKEAIDIFYTMRTQVPEFFENLNFNHPSVQDSMKKLLVGHLPTKDENDCVYVYYQLNQMKVSEWHPNDISKVIFMASETAHLKMGSGSGYIIAADFKHLSLAHLLSVPISTLQNILKYLQEASHYKIVSLHFINGGAIMDKLMMIIKPFLKEEVKRVICMHSNWEEFNNQLPKKYIPSDCGGTAPSMQELHNRTLEAFAEKSEWFVEDSKLLVDENKRPASPKNINQLKGSFKKLDID